MRFLSLTRTWYYMLLENGGMGVNQTCGYQPLASGRDYARTTSIEQSENICAQVSPLSMLGGENNTSSWPHTASLRLILTGDTGKHTRDLGVGIQLAQEAPLPSERTGWPDHDLANGRLVMLQARAAHVPSLRFRLMPSACIAWQPRSAGQGIPSISAMSSSTKASPT